MWKMTLPPGVYQIEVINNIIIKYSLNNWTGIIRWGEGGRRKISKHNLIQQYVLIAGLEFLR